jgi:hypothetical protein
MYSPLNSLFIHLFHSSQLANRRVLADRVTRWVCEKNHPTLFWIHNFYRGKSIPLKWDTLIFKKLSKENNRPLGENSPNLATLLAQHDRLWSGCSAYNRLMSCTLETRYFDFHSDPEVNCMFNHTIQFDSQQQSFNKIYFSIFLALEGRGRCYEH